MKTISFCFCILCFVSEAIAKPPLDTPKIIELGIDTCIAAASRLEFNEEEVKNTFAKMKAMYPKCKVIKELCVRVNQLERCMSFDEYKRRIFGDSP